MPTSEIIEKLIYASSMAPSPENNQPWHFIVHKDFLTLDYVPDRALQTDNKNVLNFMSLGAALENMKIQATKFGLVMSWQLQALTQSPRIRIQFVRKQIVIDPLVNFISRRHTNRHLYSTKNILQDEIDHLSKVMLDISEIHCNILQTRLEKRRMAKAFRLFDQVRFSYKVFHTELFKSLHFSRREVFKKRHGLDVECLALPRGGASFLKMIRFWSIFCAFNYLGLSRVLSRMTERQLKYSGALIVISAPSMAAEDIITAGQAMQRIWLAATEKGLSVQPFGHPAIFQNLTADVSTIYRKRDQEKIKQALNDFRQQLSLNQGYLPLLVLRVGHARTQVRAEKPRFLPSEITTWPKYAGSESAHYHDKAFSRSLGLVTKAELEKLRNKTVAIPGLGGVGGQHLVTLARLGVGGFHIADEDHFTSSNVNRQYGAMVSSLTQSKVEVMGKLSLDINPHLRLNKWSTFINETNIEEFLIGVDLVIDSIDAFNVRDRITLFETARRMGIPIISAGPIGYSASLVIFTPESESFTKYIDYREGDAADTTLSKFIIGICPKIRNVLGYMDDRNIDTTVRVGPSSVTATTLCSGFAGIEALKLLLGRGQVKAAPYYHYYDGYLNYFKVGYDRWSNRHPWRRLLIKLMARRLLATRQSKEKVHGAS